MLDFEPGSAPGTGGGQDGGDDTPTSGLAAQPYAYTINLAPGQIRNDVDFGDRPEDVTPPNPPTDLQIDPDTGPSATDGVTNTGAVRFSGVVDEVGLTVSVFDVTEDTDLGLATVCASASLFASSSIEKSLDDLTSPILENPSSSKVFLVLLPSGSATPFLSPIFTSAVNM